MTEIAGDYLYLQTSNPNWKPRSM